MNKIIQEAMRITSKDVRLPLCIRKGIVKQNTTMSNNITIEFKFKESYDSAAKCYIVYCKKYNISGYGKTIKQAYRMAKFSINEILTPCAIGNSDAEPII